MYLFREYIVILRGKNMNNNPLRQYFRRPSVYIKLPFGCNHYGAEIVTPSENEELPVYPMTAIDEITIKTPDALFNGIAVVDIIKSCVPNIKDPWKINSVDLDAILLAIRAVSMGDQFELETTCPKCEEVSKYGIQLADVLASLSAIPYGQELIINELSIKFKPLTYKELNDTNIKQFEVQRILKAIDNLPEEEQLTKTKDAIMAITEITIDVIAKTIEYIKTPSSVVEEKEYIADFLKNCDKKVYSTIRDYNTELKDKTSIKPFDVKCVDCGHEYKQPFTVNYSDFFG